MMDPTDVDLVERVIAVLLANTRALEDLQIAVVTLSSQLAYAQVFPESDHRPIEDRKPIPTIHQDEQ